MEFVSLQNANDNCCSEQHISECAQKLKVCGHPMRLQLLCRIAQEHEPCVSELWSCLEQPQPVISQHLAVLKQKRIVKSEVRGNKRVYSIVDPFIRKIVESLLAGAPAGQSDVREVSPSLAESR